MDKELKIFADKIDADRNEMFNKWLVYQKVVTELNSFPSIKKQLLKENRQSILTEILFNHSNTYHRKNGLKEADIIQFITIKNYIKI